MAKAIREEGVTPQNTWEADLTERVIGQDISQIVQYIRTYQSGMHMRGRPPGVFLLLGPTGTGKTRTVEALAEVLHHEVGKLIRVDCGEFQREHEIARLVGAPPGYLGHRETTALLTTKRIAQATSDHSALSVLLFDEIEKAAPSFSRLLLGVLDRATLSLGDNTSVNFENTMIFMTSNLGARGVAKAMERPIGLPCPRQEVSTSRIRGIAMSSLRRKFSPEFLNRVDEVLCYKTLTEQDYSRILDIEMQKVSNIMLDAIMGTVKLSPALRAEILSDADCPQYGARELKRLLQRRVIQPVANEILAGNISRSEPVMVTVHPKGRVKATPFQMAVAS
jgi:ATP-dependent Clp protease ATP-binding subunit ClpA